MLVLMFGFLLNHLYVLTSFDKQGGSLIKLYIFLEG